MQSIPVLEWPNNLPPPEDSFFSIFCDEQDLYWLFHKPDGTFCQWRTPHITQINDKELMRELEIHFPENSEPLKYIFGSSPNNTFPEVLTQAKERKVANLFVYLLDDSVEAEVEAADPNKDDQDLTALEKDHVEKNAIYATQLDLLYKLWSAVPCQMYKINANTFIESSSTLSMHKDKFKSFSSQTVAMYNIADVHFCQPMITINKSKSGYLSYIGSCDSESDDGNKLITTGKIPHKLSTGTDDKDDSINEMGKVLKSWKEKVQAMQNTDDDFKPTIILGNDINHDLESQFIKMLQQNEKADKDVYEFCHILLPIPHGVDHLIVNGREKANMEKRAKEQEERRLAQLEAKLRKERAAAAKKKKAQEEAAKKRRLEEERKRKAAAEREEARKQREAHKRKRRKESDRPLDNPKSFIGTKVAKEFDDGIIYFGEVKEFINDVEDGDEPFWNVVYDDGDGEDLDEDELVQSIAFYREVMKKNANSKKKLKVFSPSSTK